MNTGADNTAMIILGDHKYGILTNDDLDSDYYTIQRDDGFSFIISSNEDGDWESDAHIDPLVVKGIGAMIDENSL